MTLNNDNSLNKNSSLSNDVNENKDLNNTVDGSKEYLDILQKVKEKVEQEKINENNFEETIVLDRSELNRTLNSLDNEQNFQEKNKVLEVFDIKKRISLSTIVEDITFNMYEGEIIGLLGPNGSGKTTIMRMMVGLTKSTKGDMYCFEKPLGLGKNKILSEVGAMIESPEFYTYMSGYSNLKQFARMSSKKISKKKIKDILEFVGLSDVAKKKVKKYSLGMRQRLGLAQALLHDPKILILDEPVNGLDPQGVKDFRNKLKEVAASGVSILISSHLLDEIEKVADRVIVLEKGKIIYDDSLDNLRNNNSIITLLNTHDNERAEILIKDLDLPYELKEEGFLFEDITKEQKAQLVSYLVNSHIEIDVLKVVSKTLEERFLEITNKGGK